MLRLEVTNRQGRLELHSFLHHLKKQYVVKLRSKSRGRSDWWPAEGAAGPSEPRLTQDRAQTQQRHLWFTRNCWSWPPRSSKEHLISAQCSLWMSAVEKGPFIHTARYTSAASIHAVEVGREDRRGVNQHPIKTRQHRDRRSFDWNSWKMWTSALLIPGVSGSQRR